MPINYNSANLDQLISNVIYGYYIKYDTLTRLIRENYQGSDATVIDIYIDIQDILRHVDNYLSKTQLPIINPLVVTSGIINMVAHYRNFFYTRFRCNSRFWLIDSVDNVLSPKYFAEFKTKHLSPNMNQIYRMNIQLLPIICNAIYDVQYEKTIVDVVTKIISIRNIEEKNPVILISKDPFTYQATAINGINILRPRKNQFGDVSEMITGDISVYAYLQAISKNLTIQPIKIDPEQLSLVMALTRVPSRNLKTFFQINTAIDKLILCYSKGLTTKYPWDQESMVNELLSATNKKKNPYELLYRLKACDVVFEQGYAYQEMAESKTYKGIVNIYDPNGIKEINNTHFKTCPLDLNVL